MISTRATRILGLLAIISIAINLFLAGSFLGGRFRGPPSPGMFEQRLGEAWDELPDADKPVARQIYAAHREDIIQKWRAARSAAQKASHDTRAKSFDADALRGDFDMSNTRFLEFRRAMQDLFLEIAAKISPEGRQRLHPPGGAF